MALVTTSAVLLRGYPYSESSRILRFFTPDHGVVGVVARGVRRSGAKGGSPLESFTGGVLTFYMKPTTDLYNFKDFTSSHRRLELGRHLLRFGGASLAAELVLRHASEEANPALFEALEQALDALDSVPEDQVFPVVLSAGWRLVSVLGYGPSFDSCVSCGTPFHAGAVGRFDFVAGGIRCPACARSVQGPRVGPRARAQLRGLLAGEAVDRIERPQAHLQLLRDFVTCHVSVERPLESFQYLASVVTEDHA